MRDQSVGGKIKKKQLTGFVKRPVFWGDDGVLKSGLRLWHLFACLCTNTLLSVLKRRLFSEKSKKCSNNFNFAVRAPKTAI